MAAKRKSQNKKSVDNSFQNPLTQKPVARTEEQAEALKSIHHNTVTFIYGSPGTGKAQDLESLVYTPDGPVRMGDIQLGDKICTPDGDVTSVIGIFPQGVKDIYEVVFNTGDKVRCCLDHLWEVDDKSRRKKKYKTSMRVYETRYIKSAIEDTKSGINRFTVNPVSFLKFNKSELTIDPYLMGCLLGDGSFTQGTPVITSADDELIKYCSNLIHSDYFINKNSKKEYHYSIKRINYKNKPNDYTEELKSLGLFGKTSIDKFIPSDYKYSSLKDRIRLLQGLLDTDGTPSGNYNIEYCTTSECLAKDIKELVESIGGNCIIKERYPEYTYNDEKKIGRLSYRCYIRYNKPGLLFRLRRKRNKMSDRKKYFCKRKIVEINYLYKKEAQCIAVDHERHLYVTDNCIPTHNTHMATLMGLYGLMHNKYERIIMTRPCVEACGENLGYLPGDLDSKIMPYLLPIQEMMGERLEKGFFNKLRQEEKIKAIPLAFQRGMNFKNAYVIADEMQNTNPLQMRLLLTRICEGTKVVLTGDLAQTDARGLNGLTDAIRRFQGVDDIGICKMTESSIVRHPIVQKVEEAYKKDDEL